MMRVVMLLAVVGAMISPIAGADHSAANAALPERPRASVDTSLPSSQGRIINVRSGADLQKALNAAQPGDTVMIEAGATFTGPFALPNKQGSGWIVVRTSTPDGRFPSPGRRADPSHAPLMAKLQAPSGSVITTAPGAHHYRFIGIELRPSPGVFLYNLVQLGANDVSAETLPHHIIFDRCYLHGDQKRGTRRGIAMNSRETAVIDSSLTDFKEVGADSQAIAGWNGPGPFKIENNLLQGAGENVMFGGADPTIKDLVPGDIEIRRNHFSKPLSWRIGDPSHEGLPWTVKNLFELKNARRVLIEGNLFEHHWPHAQNGFAILFTVANQDGSAPWSVIEDVTFINNVVRQTASGINVSGRDTGHGSQRLQRLLVRNNLFEAIGSPRWGGGGRLFQFVNGAVDVRIEQNTAFQTDHIVMAEGEPNRGFVFEGNIVPHNEYGVFGSGMGSGVRALERYFPGAIFRNNVIIGSGVASAYPKNNFLPSSSSQVGFADHANGDYRLLRSSRYVQVGDDGKSPGVDFKSLCHALAQTPLLLPSCSPQ